MAKNGFIAAMDNLPWIVKIILCIPALNIIYAIYRIIKGASTNNLLMLVIGILWIVPGAVFCWIIDMICVIAYGNPKFFA